MKHKVVGAALALTFVAAYAGGTMSSAASELPSASGAAGSHVRAGDDSVPLRIGSTVRRTTANPVDQPFSSVAYVAYDALVRTLYGEVEPRLAEGWEELGPNVLRFTLRDDVTFHNGDPLLAADVAFTFNLTKAEGFGNATSLDTFVAATAVDDRTVDIEFVAPDALALEKIGMIPIMSESYWDEVGGREGFNDAPNGTGPFKILDWSPDTTIKFERFEDYWDTPAASRYVDLLYFPDQQALLAALESGQIDVAHQLAASAIPILSDNADFELVVAFGWGSQMLQLNTTKPPFDDPNLRRAANLAVDREGLIASLTYGAGFIEDGQVTYEGINGYDPTVTAPEYDVDAARELVAASDYAGEPIVISGPTTGVVMEAVAGGLAEAGFNVQVNAQEQVAWFEEFQQGSDADVFYRGMSYTGIFDASRAYRWFHHSAKPFVTDETWMELWEAQATELDRPARTALLEEMTQHIADNDYVLFTYSAPSVGATVPGVTGVEWFGVMLKFDGAQIER